jgi:hypothetical protein
MIAYFSTDGHGKFNSGGAHTESATLLSGVESPALAAIVFRGAVATRNDFLADISLIIAM